MLPQRVGDADLAIKRVKGVGRGMTVAVGSSGEVIDAVEVVSAQIALGINDGPQVVLCVVFVPGDLLTAGAGCRALGDPVATDVVLQPRDAAFGVGHGDQAVARIEFHAADAAASINQGDAVAYAVVLDFGFECERVNRFDEAVAGIINIARCVTASVNHPQAIAHGVELIALKVALGVGSTSQPITKIVFVACGARIDRAGRLRTRQKVAHMVIFVARNNAQRIRLACKAVHWVIGVFLLATQCVHGRDAVAVAVVAQTRCLAERIGPNDFAIK